MRGHPTPNPAPRGGELFSARFGGVRPQTAPVGFSPSLWDRRGMGLQPKPAQTVAANNWGKTWFLNLLESSALMYERFSRSKFQYRPNKELTCL